MRLKGIVLIVIAFFGVIFISTFDIVMGKPVNDISGPKSIISLMICLLFLIKGIVLVRR